MREKHYLLPQDHTPVPFHRWAQEEIAWGLREAEAALSPPSAMGKMMEGQVRAVGADIIEDPARWMAETHARTEAARKYRLVGATLKMLSAARLHVLDRVYGDPVSETDLLAFGGTANLVPESEVAVQCHRKSRSKLEFLQWASRLAVNLAGEKYEDRRIVGKYLRRPARASDSERAMAQDIRRDTEKTLIDALAAYAIARPRR